MKTYRVKIIAKRVETYAVQASNADEAEEYWAEGKLVDTDDNIENEILSIEEA